VDRSPRSPREVQEKSIDTRLALGARDKECPRHMRTSERR
jgi:hypothetical protein